MKIQPKHRLMILLTVVVIAFSGILLFACGTSNEQQRQITNAFTPGKATQPADPSGNLAPAADETGFAAQTQPGTAAILTDQPTMMITNDQGQSVVVTQTRVASQPSQAANTRTAQPTTQNPYPVASATVTRTATPIPTNTSTPTQIPTLQTGWAGEWKVNWQLDNQTYVEGSLTVEVVDTDFTASGVIGGTNYSFTGRIIFDGETAFGNWTSATSSGGFIWRDVGEGQFGGSRDNNFGFCGARSGVEPPNPCYIPPLL